MADIAGVDLLWNAVRLSAADAAMGDHVMNQREIVEAAVKATLNCLLGNGLVTLVPPEEWPMWLKMHPEVDEVSHD